MANAFLIGATFALLAFGIQKTAHGVKRGALAISHEAHKVATVLHPKKTK